MHAFGRRRGIPTRRHESTAGSNATGTPGCGRSIVGDIVLEALLSAQSAQRRWLEDVVARMRPDELREVILCLGEYLDPIARGALLDVVAELGRAAPFSDSTQRRTRR